jgi:predicted peptidase
MKELVKTRRVALAAVAFFALACSGDAGSPTSPGGNDTGNTGNPGNNNGSTVPEAGTFVKGTVSVGTGTYPYQVFVPKAYNSGAKWPVILYMHSAAEKGTDGNAQVSIGLAPVVKAQATTFPAFAVFPQLPPGEGADRTMQKNIELAALNKVEQTYNIDATRQYVTGVSMGGVLVYELAYDSPTRFAAIVPVSATLCDPCVTGNPTAAIGSAYPLVAQKLSAEPTWIFHGQLDPLFPVSIPRNIVAAFKAAGNAVTYTEYPTAGHTDVMWNTVYSTPELFTWLFAQHR